MRERRGQAAPAAGARPPPVPCLGSTSRNASFLSCMAAPGLAPPARACALPREQAGSPLRKLQFPACTARHAAHSPALRPSRTPVHAGNCSPSGAERRSAASAVVGLVVLSVAQCTPGTVVEVLGPRPGRGGSGSPGPARSLPAPRGAGGCGQQGAGPGWPGPGARWERADPSPAGPASPRSSRCTGALQGGGPARPRGPFCAARPPPRRARAPRRRETRALGLFFGLFLFK